MRWFQGGIAEAVATSKARNAVFVVFVEGKDDASKNTAATVDHDVISSKLQSEDFVAIKLDSGSEAYRQFAQIYQLVPVPSMFFIGGNGVPLEVVAGEINVPELLHRITSVLEKSGKVVSPEDKASLAGTQEAKQYPKKDSPDEAGGSNIGASTSKEVENLTKNQTIPAVNAVAEALSAEEKVERAKELIEELSAEEKVERAKELIEKKQKEKEEEEGQTRRQKEIERRKMGQEVQKLRQWQQDQELKHLKEERRKEKAEEAAVRERILKQIAQDRAERASRCSAEQEAAKKQTEEEHRRRSEQQARDTSAKCDVARIQFRLPDGSAHSHNFEATATLGEVRLYAATQLNFPFREFAMSTSFPRREFTANDHSQTVRDLQLVPTAVILILPVSSGSVVTSSSQNYGSTISRMVWSLLTPFFSVLNYLRNLVFGGGGGGGGGASVGGSSSSFRNRNTQQSSPPNSASVQSPTGARRRTPTADTTTIRRQGNVHRLTNHRDSSDDENNTWNGNSTQQM